MLVYMITGIFIVTKYGHYNDAIGNGCIYHDRDNKYTAFSSTLNTVIPMENMYGCIPKEWALLSVQNYYPEIDDSPLHLLNDYQTYQMLLGMF